MPSYSLIGGGRTSSVRRMLKNELVFSCNFSNTAALNKELAVENLRLKYRRWGGRVTVAPSVPWGYTLSIDYRDEGNVEIGHFPNEAIAFLVAQNFGR